MSLCLRLKTCVPACVMASVALLCLAFAVACGGAGQASYPGSAPLTLSLHDPAEGVVVARPDLLVKGQVSKADAFVACNGQPISVDATGAFQAPMSLKVGANQVVVEAWTSADAKLGRGSSLLPPQDKVAARVARNLTYQKPALALVVTAPVEGATFTTPAITVSGTISEPSATVTMNGDPLPVDGSGAFQGPAILQLGSNTLAFLAIGADGRNATETRTVTYVTTPPPPPPPTPSGPVIHLDHPMDGFATHASSVLVQGHVDDPTHTVVLQGERVPVDALGRFERTINAPRLGVLGIEGTATNAAGLKASEKIYVIFETDPPLLAWADPTPAEGVTLSVLQIPAAVTVSKAALVSINGQRTELEPNEGSPSGHPFKAQAELAVQEGQVVLTAQAVDRAGNQASITRTLAVGFTKPTITVEMPAFDASGVFTTANIGVTLTGHVDALEICKPLTFTVNGQPSPLDPQGRFSVPLSLLVGSNPLALEAMTRFGQKASQSLTVLRTAGIPDPGTAPGIVLDWPQNGFVSGMAQIVAKGRVLVPGMTATLNGAAVTVDPQTLAFSGSVTLQPGPNTLTALGTDAQARTATASAQGTYLPPGAATYTWLTPVDGAHVTSRRVPITGKADQPGIVSITVNGVPMALDPSQGTFSGSLDLSGVGRQTLILQALALSGETKSERREVVFETPLPRIELQAPGSVRPGDLVPIQVRPAPGTALVKADLSWNGRFLATVTAPWAVVQAQVPADAGVGSQIAVEALGTDDQGAMVTARTTVSVYGSGALMVEAYDDALGLPLTDKKAAVTLEGTLPPGGPTQALDEHGRAALATAVPQNWIKVSKEGCTPSGAAPPSRWVGFRRSPMCGSPGWRILGIWMLHAMPVILRQACSA